MKHLCALLLGAVLVSGASVPLRVTAFESGPGGPPAGWRIWAQRAEIAPRGYVDAVVSHSGQDGSLVLTGDSNSAEFGGWEHEVTGIQPGKWYRFSVYYKAEGLTYEPHQILPRLEWRQSNGKIAGVPDYASRTQTEGEWRRVTLDTPAPDRAASVRLQLVLVNAPQATVWWDDLSLEEIPESARRPVTVASVFWRPSGRSTSENNLKTFADIIDRDAPGKTDVILLPEGSTVIGTGKTYIDVSEPVPGPTTKMLGEFARRRNSYVAAGIYEREGQAVYNTTVLLDRKGNLAGKYRKVYLPMGEVDGGLTAGNDYPVFQTDFGKVGIMICYDLFFPDPARALTLRGAELILLPIWGGDETLGKARAIENHVYIASSGYDYPTMIMDRTGEVLSRAPQRGSVAVATIDLNRREARPFAGETRNKYPRHLRLDVPVIFEGYGK
jgi:predicted amidohydrolase